MIRKYRHHIKEGLSFAVPVMGILSILAFFKGLPFAVAAAFFFVATPIMASFWAMFYYKQTEQAHQLKRENEALTCECGGLALPVNDTEDRYFCPQCSRRFAGPPHSY